jgi:hypothetical protein
MAISYIRFRANGRAAMRDVGDFVAHKQERDQGPVISSTRDWCIAASYYFLIKQREIDFHNLPGNFPDFLTTVLNRTDNQTLKKKVGITLISTRKLLPVLTEQLRNANGSMSVKKLIAQRY